MNALPSNDDEVLLLHNPRCSKSRATLALLEERGVDFRTRLYLEQPLTADELRELGRRLGKPLGQWVRTKEAAWGEAGVEPTASEDKLADAVAATPVLMERPIVVRGTSARVGRPPEDVLELFDGA